MLLIITSNIYFPYTVRWFPIEFQERGLWIKLGRTPVRHLSMPINGYTCSVLCEQTWELCCWLVPPNAIATIQFPLELLWEWKTSKCFLPRRGWHYYQTTRYLAVQPYLQISKWYYFLLLILNNKVRYKVSEMVLHLLVNLTNASSLTFSEFTGLFCYFLSWFKR